MSITLAGITADELLEGYDKGIGPRGPIIRKRYMVPWANGDAFANALMGITNAVGGVGSTIYRTFSHQCPESLNLVALEVGPIEGVGVPTIADGRPEWEWAIVPVIYGISPVSFGGSSVVPGESDPNNLFTPDGQAYEFCSFDKDYSSESLTIPAQSMIRADGPKAHQPIKTSWTVRLSTSTLIITIHKIPWLPNAALDSLQGRINDRTFMGYAAETLLFEGAKSHTSYSSDGTVTKDLVEVFKYREHGYLRVPGDDDMTRWDYVTHDGNLTGHYLYQQADLRPLIFGVTLS